MQAYGFFVTFCPDDLYIKVMKELSVANPDYVLVRCLDVSEGGIHVGESQAGDCKMAKDYSYVVSGHLVDSALGNNSPFFYLKRVGDLVVHRLESDGVQYDIVHKDLVAVGCGK